MLPRVPARVRSAASVPFRRLTRNATLARRDSHRLLDQFFDDAHHFRRFDVDHLLDHPLVVAGRHGIGHLVGEKNQARIAGAPAEDENSAYSSKRALSKSTKGLRYSPGPKRSS